MTMNLSSFIELLECVERGSLSCAEARSQFENSKLVAFPESEIISSQLNHYWCDDDIRQRDLDYRMMQNGELAKLIQKLQEEDYRGAASITFLHVS
jgi:hypothetical protein